MRLSQVELNTGKSTLNRIRVACRFTVPFFIELFVHCFTVVPPHSQSSSSREESIVDNNYVTIRKLHPALLHTDGIDVISRTTPTFELVALVFLFESRQLDMATPS